MAITYLDEETDTTAPAKITYLDQVEEPPKITYLDEPKPETSSITYLDEPAATGISAPPPAARDAGTIAKDLGVKALMGIESVPGTYGASMEGIGSLIEKIPDTAMKVAGAISPVGGGVLSLLGNEPIKAAVTDTMKSVGGAAKDYYGDVRNRTEDALMSEQGKTSDSVAWNIAGSIAESAPQMVADYLLTLGMGKAARGTETARQAVSSAMEGNSAGGQQKRQVEELIQKMPDAELSNLPGWQDTLAEAGGDPIKARSLAATKAGNNAYIESFVTTSLTSLGLNKLMGATLEKWLLDPKKGRQTIKQLLKMTGTEASEEGLQSGFDQITQNYETGRPLGENVPTAMGYGAATGSIMAGGISTIHHLANRNALPPPLPNETPPTMPQETPPPLPVSTDVSQSVEQTGVTPAIPAGPSAADLMAQRMGSAEDVIPGRETTVVGARNTKLPATYAWIPRGNVEASNIGPTFAKNPNYPLTNTRDYTNKSEQEKVLRTINEWDPQQHVTDSVSASVGPSMVARITDTDGAIRYVTLGGNTREMAIKSLSPEQRAAQFDAEAAKAEQFGLPKPASPDLGLYRVLGDFDLRKPGERAKLQQTVDALNPSPGKIQNVAEMAMVDAEHNLPIDDMTRLSMDISAADAQGFMQNQIARGQLDPMLRGSVSETGPAAQNYVRQALAYSAFRRPDLMDWTAEQSRAPAAAALTDQSAPALVSLRSHGLGELADTLSRGLGSIIQQFKSKKGGNLINALSTVAQQQDLDPTMKLVQDVAGTLKALTVVNAKGKIDAEQSAQNYGLFWDTMRKSADQWQSTPDLFGNQTSPEEMTGRVLRFAREKIQSPTMQVSDFMDTEIALAPTVDVYTQRNGIVEPTRKAEAAALTRTIYDGRNESKAASEQRYPISRSSRVSSGGVPDHVQRQIRQQRRQQALYLTDPAAYTPELTEALQREHNVSRYLWENVQGEHQPFDIAGKIIRGPADWATLQAATRSPVQESYKVAATDPSGRVVLAEVLSYGDLTGTAVSPDKLNNFMERARALGGTTIWHSHNHPSGHPEPSRQDHEVYAKIEMNILNAHMKLGDGIITDSTKFWSQKQNAVLRYNNGQQAWETGSEHEAMKLTPQTFSVIMERMMPQTGRSTIATVVNAHNEIVAMMLFPENMSPTDIQHLSTIGKKAGGKSVMLGYGTDRNVSVIPTIPGLTVLDIATPSTPSMKLSGQWPGDAERRAALEPLRKAMAETVTEDALPYSTPENPWPENFPKIQIHTTRASVMAKYPELFDKAKKGDSDAADALILKTTKGSTIRELASRYPTAKVAYVHAEEATGRNKIPVALARTLHIAGLEVEPDIVQNNRTFHTASNARERFVRRAEFNGPVEPGRDYILIDDHATAGGTLSALRNYIEAGGGNVVSIMTLTASQGSTTIALQSGTRIALERKFGRENINAILQRENIYHSLDALTESEAKYLLQHGSLDAIRNSIAAGRQSGSVRAAGITRNDPSHSGQIDQSFRVNETTASYDAAEPTGPINEDNALLFVAKGPAKLPITIQVRMNGMEYVKPFEMPELLRLAREMGANVKLVKSMGNANGKFIGNKLDPQIKLVRRLFADPRAAARTLSHEIGHMDDFMDDAELARGNVIGRIHALKKYLKATYGESSVTNKELREELKALSAWWRPWERDNSPESYRKYRDSAIELYADGVSVLLNSPKQLQERAPKFFRQLLSNLDARPEAKAHFFELWDLLARPHLQISAKRHADYMAMKERGDEVLLARAAEREQKDESWATKAANLKQQYFDAMSPAIDKINAAKKAGAKVPWHEDPTVIFDEHPLASNNNYRYMQLLDREVLTPLREAGISEDTLGKYLFLNRVLNERYTVERKGPDGKIIKEEAGRAVLANAKGYTPDVAQKELMIMRLELGMAQKAQGKDTSSLEAWTTLTNSANYMQDQLANIMEDAWKGGLIKTDQINQIQANKRNYATFASIDRIEQGGNIPAGIRKQVGSLDDIVDPFTATVIKANMMLKWIQYEKAKSGFVDFAQKYLPGTFEPAELHWNGTRWAPNDPPYGKGQIMRMKNGEPEYLNTDPAIAEMYESVLPADFDAAIQIMNTFFREFIYPMWITYNPKFGLVRNPLKDFQRNWRNMAAMDYKSPGLALLKSYFNKENRDAVRAYLSGQENPIIAEMLENFAISMPQNEQTKMYRPRRTSYIDKLMEEYNLIPPEKQPGLFKWLQDHRMGGVATFLDVVGNLIRTPATRLETMGKVAPYTVMRAQKKAPEQAASQTRNFVGTPPWYRKGSHVVIARSISPFFNIMLRGWETDLKLMKSKDTMGAWWLHWALTSGIWTAMKALAKAGVLGAAGAALKEVLDGISEQQTSNNHIIPLGIRTNVDSDIGKEAVAIRIPMSDTDRFISALFYQSITSIFSDQRTSLGSKLSPIVSTFAGDLPGLTPAVPIGAAWLQYASQAEPFDITTGRNILDKETGLARLGAMIAWTGKEMGALNLVGYDPKAKSTTAKVISVIPGLNSLILTTDYGWRETQSAADKAQDQVIMTINASMSKETATDLAAYYKLRSITAALRTPEQQNTYMRLSNWYRNAVAPAQENARDEATAGRVNDAKAIMRRIQPAFKPVRGQPTFETVL